MRMARLFTDQVRNHFATISQHYDKEVLGKSRYMSISADKTVTKIIESSASSVDAIALGRYRPSVARKIIEGPVAMISKCSFIHFGIRTSIEFQQISTGRTFRLVEDATCMHPALDVASCQDDDQMLAELGNGRREISTWWAGGGGG